MFGDLNWITPTLPDDLNQWATLFVIAETGLVKLYRGKVMHDHAARIDIFGWSVILFDAVFGASLVTAAIWMLYPVTHTTWLDWGVLIAIAIVATWQAFMVVRAGRERVDRAMSPVPPKNEHGHEIPYDRRRRDRRKETRDMKMRLSELERGQ